MLRVVTDSHVPPVVAKAARKLAPLEITALRDWHGGLYLHESDWRLLALAWEERVTLVTYDLNTFPLVVKERLETGFVACRRHLRVGALPAERYRRDRAWVGEALAGRKGLGLDKSHSISGLTVACSQVVSAWCKP
jgi:hypothetical protein